MDCDAIACGLALAVSRQALEQYFTSSQFFAHFFRQDIGRPQAVQGFEGNDCLLPLCGRVIRDCSRCCPSWLHQEHRCG